MIRTTISSLGVVLLGAAAFAADAPTIGQTLDGQFRNADREIVPLAEALPADKYNFAPTNGEFKGVRTFALQVRHMATYIYLLSSTILEQQPPVDIGPPTGDFNGPDSLRTKEQIVDYLKGAVAYGHKALQSITEKNQMDQVGRPSGGPKMARFAAATFMLYHDMDHYGQMVVYLRMNGIVPPASQPRR
jgi:uncharacterized damage-inducible protein DinB